MISRKKKKEIEERMAAIEKEQKKQERIEAYKREIQLRQFIDGSPLEEYIARQK